MVRLNTLGSRGCSRFTARTLPTRGPCQRGLSERSRVGRRTRHFLGHAAGQCFKRFAVKSYCSGKTDVTF